LPYRANPVRSIPAGSTPVREYSAALLRAAEYREL
jgi:hypothetical protein